MKPAEIPNWGHLGGREIAVVRLFVQKFEVSNDDGNDGRDNQLDADGVFGGAVNLSDVELPFDEAEECLYLPAFTIHLTDFGSCSVKDIGDEDKGIFAPFKRGQYDASKAFGMGIVAVFQTCYDDFVLQGLGAEFRGCLREREVVGSPFGADDKVLIAPSILAEKVFVFIPSVRHDDAVRRRVNVLLCSRDVRHFPMRQTVKRP